MLARNRVLGAEYRIRSVLERPVEPDDWLHIIHRKPLIGLSEKLDQMVTGCSEFIVCASVNSSETEK